MYTIGQFSRICSISTKALRHYEKIGLLSPAKVDQTNQYRYYSREQIAEVQTITFFKELGIPLQTIKHIIQEGNDQEMIAAVLDDHRKVLMEEMGRCNERLANLAKWRKTTEAKIMTEKNKYDIRIMDVPEILVHADRKVLSNPKQNLPAIVIGLLKDIEDAGGVCAGAPLMLYYDEEFNPDKIDVEVAWPVLDPALGNRTLPAVRAACYTYVGPYDGIPEAYQAIFAWINENGYQALPPLREVYISDPATTTPEQLVTNIQVPIKVG